MRSKLQKTVLAFISTYATYASIASFHSTTYAETKLVEMKDKCNKLVEYSTELWEENTIKDSLIYKIQSRIDSNEESVNELDTSIKTVTERMKEYKMDPSEVNWSRLEEACTSSSTKIERLKDLVEESRDILKGGGGNNTSSFWGFDDLTQMMSNYDAFLETLTLNQKYAIIHILLSFIIFLSISNIVMLYLGDEIIKYLKLEEKYPKLAKYIQLRRKFITYNMMFDSLVIFIALIVIVGFNLYNFTTL